MTDDSQPDAETSNGNVSDGESSGDSRIDEFLERIEDDPQSSELDSTESVSPESSESDPTESVPPEPQSNQQDSAESKKRGRLWDSFSSGRSDDEDGDTPQPTTKESDSGPGEPPTESSPNEWDTPDDSGKPTPDSAADPSSTDTDPSSTDTDQSSTDTSPSSTDTDRSSTDTETKASSFRTILKRISHRIGSVGSESADTPDSADTAATETEAPNTGVDDSTRSNPGGPASASRSASGSASSARSDTIDEILNNIDLFGRATSSSQVLLLSPTAHSITNDVYSRFLLPADGAGQNILFVSAIQSASDQLAAVQEIPHWQEGNTAVIEVGQSTLKPTQPNMGEDVTRQLDIYKQISNLKHLAKLGINISHIVSQWNNSRRPTVVGIHTLSAIQQYVGNETMFQFLFTLKGQLNSMGVMGFYHMDPAAHTDNEISTIQSAFDLVIKVSSDGSVDIL